MQHDCPSNKHPDQLIFDSKQTVWIVSALLLLLFFVFMVGYFFGKHQALEQFSHTLDQESISDKIYCSLYAARSTSEHGAQQESASEKQASEVNQESPVDMPQESEQAYYAPLMGFGSQKLAQRCVDRLTRQGFPVLLKQRISKTPKGREVQWYQVVTKPFTIRAELEALIALLEKQERLNTVKIITRKA